MMLPVFASPPLGLAGATVGLGFIAYVSFKSSERIQYVGPDEQIL